jgi:N-acetylneuraminic acid mutarotase
MKKIACVIMSFVFVYPVVGQTTNYWSRIADYGGVARANAISFSLDSFGYVGASGEYQLDTFPYTTIYPTDFWQYDMSTNVWVQKAQFLGVGRVAAISFVIGSKAYFGLGQSGSSIEPQKDMWEYDPLTNTWTQLSDFPGGGRSGALGFSNNSKGYVGMGISDTSRVMKDMWQYDPSTDRWTQLSDFPGPDRDEASLFNIGGIEYVGFGYNTTSWTCANDMWSYNPSTDTWAQLTNFAGKAVSGLPFGFTIGNKGYVNMLYDSSGSSSDYFWRYNPLSDTWTKEDSFIGTALQGLSFFSLGDRGYAGIGLLGNIGNCKKDFWVYTPDSISTGIKEVPNELNVVFYPNPVRDVGILQVFTNANTNVSIQVFDVQGQKMQDVYSGQLSGGDSTFNVDTRTLSSGLYIIQLNAGHGKQTFKFTKL